MHTLSSRNGSAHFSAAEDVSEVFILVNLMVEIQYVLQVFTCLFLAYMHGSSLKVIIFYFL